MKVLKMKNGLALVAVVILLFVLTLLVPAMLTYADTATSIAVNGTAKQKASYLARAGLEIAVSAFQRNSLETSGPIYTYFNNNLVNNGDDIDMETVYMYTGKDKAENATTGNLEFPVAYATAADKASYDANAAYQYVGKVDTKVVYKYKTHVFKVYSDNATPSEDLCCGTAQSPGRNNTELAKALSGYVSGTTDANLSAHIKACPVQSSKSDDYQYTKYTYDQYEFEASAYVGGTTEDKKVVRTASAMRTSEAGKLGWVSGTSDAFKSTAANGGSSNNGILQVTVDPDKATTKYRMYYEDDVAGQYNIDPSKTNKKMVPVDVLVYAAMGNLRIASTFATAFPAMTNAQIRAATNTSIEDGALDTMKNSMPVYLGCKPSLSFFNGEEKSHAADWIDGVTYGPDGYVTNNGVKELEAGSSRSENFVYFAATADIEVAIPIDVSVCPARVGGKDSPWFRRFGDGNIINLGDTPFNEKQGSMYKMMGFQANTIIFNKDLVMSMSFVPPGGLGNTARTAKRLGSIVLSAPESTTYTYLKDNGTTVRAGRVYFKDDVYIVIYDHNDFGKGVSNGSVGGMLDQETEYTNYQKLQSGNFGITGKTLYTNTGRIIPKNIAKKSYTFEDNRDYYTVYKLFNAGDVCYFSADVMKEVEGEQVNVGVSLGNWFVDAVYQQIIAVGEANTIWEEISNWFTTAFQNFFYGAFASGTYALDDIICIGNAAENSNVVPNNTTTGLFIVWND